MDDASWVREEGERTVEENWLFHLRHERLSNAKAPARDLHHHESCCRKIGDSCSGTQSDACDGGE